MISKDIRFAHIDGYTDVTFDETGRYIVSGGYDGAVRIWDGYNDSSPVSHQVGSCVYALALISGQLFVSIDNNSVKKLSFPGGESLGTLTRFTSSVYHINGSVCGEKVALAGSDFLVKVVTLADDSQKVFTGHQAPVLSVALNTNFVASASCDGTVKIWDLNTGECVKTLTVLSKSNDLNSSKSLGRLCWSHDQGRFLCVPVEKEVRFYTSNNWECSRKLTDDHFEGDISLISFSKCGKYLAACDIKGRFVIWEVLSGSVLLKETHADEEPVCALAWNPKNSMELVYSDNQGQLGMIQLEENPPSTEDKVEIVESDDEDISLQIASKKKKSAVALTEEEEDGIDIGAIKAEYEPKIFGSQNENNEAEDKAIASSSNALAAKYMTPQKVPLNVQQEAFTPGSTPVHLQHRFMLWNNIGIVRSYNTEEENSIDVEFHDVSLYHTVHLNNSLGHHLAALSHEALILACPLQEDSCSKIFCLHFGSWDSSREWSIDLTDGEQVEALSLGTDFAACVTNMCFLRLFSIGGLQLAVISISGPVVCMAAHEHTLLVVHHQSAGLVDDQHLVASKYNVLTGRLFPSGQQTLALTPKSTLTWFGFTDEGTPCTVDSTGIVRLEYSSSWTPILNTKENCKGKSDHYFPIGLSQFKQELRCIPCKGARYPPTLPRPALSTLSFKMPFCELLTDKGELEENFCRFSQLLNFATKLNKNGYQVDDVLEEANKKIVEKLMRLFALSARSEREFRALEVGKLMPNSNVVEGAIRYASQLHCMALAERLSEVANDKMEQDFLSDSPMEETIEEEDEEEIILQKTREAEQLKKRLSRNTVETEVKPLSIIPRNRKSNIARNLHSDENESVKLAEKKISSVVENKPTKEGESINDNILELSDLEDELEESYLNEEESEELPEQSTRLLPKKNPFKMSSQPIKTVGSIDSVLNISVEQQKTKNSPNQGATNKKANSTEKGRTAGFQLYLDECKIELIKANPILDENGIVKLAIANFKKLSSEDKKEWNQKAKTGKRKQPQLGNSSKRSKTNMSDNTLTKISSFMFSKKD